MAEENIRICASDVFGQIGGPTLLRREAIALEIMRAWSNLQPSWPIPCISLDF